ncbi:MAG: hypothetical protein IT310_12900 [Anaerolineales bacterium]|nr:hypothetical protein [Anaerolineales bacterium]MCZ2122723.1 hypothetical protein [Anaerolineales bacterium]
MTPDRKKILFGLIVTLLIVLIASVFYSPATAQSVNADDVIRTIREWKSNNLKNEKWTHLVYSVTLAEPQGVVLPNGEPMPASYITDDWYYVNEAGLVEKGVFSMRDNEGNLLQQSAFQNNVMINFTFEDRQENLELFPLNIDLGFERQIMEASNKGIGIKKSEVTADGKSSLVYAYTEELQLPTQLGAEQMVVDSIVKKGFFDIKTEDLAKIQTIWILMDGTEVVYETVQIISIDSYTAAPDEIARRLEGVE